MMRVYTGTKNKPNPKHNSLTVVTADSGNPSGKALQAQSTCGQSVLRLLLEHLNYSDSNSLSFPWEINLNKLNDGRCFVFIKQGQTGKQTKQEECIEVQGEMLPAHTEDCTWNRQRQPLPRLQAGTRVGRAKLGHQPRGWAREG